VSLVSDVELVLLHWLSINQYNMCSFIYKIVTVFLFTTFSLLPTSYPVIKFHFFTNIINIYFNIKM